LALKQHIDERIRLEQQVENSRSYVVPFVEVTRSLGPGVKVLEVGCGEGGVLLPFAEKGCTCVGVDLNPIRIDMANDMLKEEVKAGRMSFILKNVYDDDFLERYRGHFDLIVLKDAIEHIPEQEKFIPYLKNFLKQGGQIYFGFPPWYMPFGGHQQVCSNKLASMLPYYHILPRPIYKGMLKMFGESEGVIDELMEIKDTQITVERFEQIIKASGMKVLHKQHYLINPIYKYKFGLKPRKQVGVLSAIPFFRNFVTTCVYYTVG
jgi:SAM-dependent methyltransferase